MTSEQRISTVESKLDLVEDILLRVARHAERANDHNDELRQELRDSSARTEATIAKLSQDVAATNARMDATHQRMDSFIDGIQRLVTQQQERVNQHEARVERLEDIAQSFLNVQVQTTRRVELLEQRLELQQQQFGQQQQQLDLQRRQIGQQQQQLDLQQEQIGQQRQQLDLQRQQIELDRQRDEEFRRSTSAALDRIDRILDYLVRQAGQDTDET